MADHTVQGLMGLTIDKVREMVDSDTIIGKPITTPDGTTILPVSKVTMGIASGGSDFTGQNSKTQFGGGSGTGISVTPVAFLVIGKDGNIRTIQLSESGDTLDRLITMLPELVDKVTDALKKKKADKAAAQPGQEAANVAAPAAEPQA